VHLDGYRNILGAALPIMAAAGYGRILGVTSGSGWRPADTGAYGCAKRAVAALTWQLGRHAPPGVVVNAMSPIAVTRMVTAALGRTRPERRGTPEAAATGGLSLGSMPAPEQLGPSGGHLVGDEFSWCSGKVFFAAGSELAVIDEPRLLEVVRTDDVTSLPHALEAVTPRALVPAEASQASNGGGNPRFGSIFDEPLVADDLPAPIVRSCAVVADSQEVADAVTTALGARGVKITIVPPGRGVAGFEEASSALASVGDRDGPVDAVVVALGGRPLATDETGDWQQCLAEHGGIVEGIHADASWARAATDQSAQSGRPLRLVTVTDASTAGGRSRGQASAQLARAARGATDGRVTAFAVSVETGNQPTTAAVGDLIAHLLCSPATTDLSGAELAAGTGWIGLRSHPRPSVCVTFGGPAVPAWLDDVLHDALA
ncbi:MAG: SDR family NAD(P)-dependent oxidoreductase, partial [Actinomycetota bacterium]|nr:SDR family NAD(P)-dependent oxidoreductase [Actinomycetota bacterium]